MKLVFDLARTQPIGDIKFHGGGKYGEIVFRKLLEKTTNVVAYYSSTKWINPEIILLCNSLGVQMIDEQSRSIVDVAYEFGKVIYSPIIGNDISKMPDDILYITTVHGLRTLEMPFDSYQGILRAIGLDHCIIIIINGLAIGKQKRISNIF